jgi:hypothetical protein
MTEKIAFDKFRYWLISLDLLEKEPNLENWNNNRLGPGEVYRILHRSDGSACSMKMLALLDDKSKRNAFSMIYVDILSFPGEKLILTLGELDVNSASKLFDEKIDAVEKKDYFKELQKDLIWNLQTSEIFEKEIKSIFPQGEPAFMNEAPFILYMEPLEVDLFSNYNIDISVDVIRNVIQMLPAHKNLWTIINGCVLLNFLSTAYPWESLIILNTNKIAENDTDIHLPNLVYHLLKQLACYHWLNYRKSQLFKTDLNFKPQNLISNTTLKQTSKSHKQLLSSLGQFNDYKISLMDELPSLRNINTSFLKYLETADIVDTDTEKFRGPSAIEHLKNVVSDSLTSIEQHIEQLTIKSQMLSSYSRDMLNTQISTINLRLQWLLAFLTIVLAFLTFILAAESPLVQKILTMLWDTLK